jgi:chitin disaccharide deacetylase
MSTHTAGPNAGTSGADTACWVIVTADDFGLCDEVNRGVLLAHREGIVTSTSLMVRQPGAVSAAAAASTVPELAVGLHVDLGEWVYTDIDGWQHVDAVVDQDDPVGVRDEVERQLERFVRLMGCSPTHLDGHQHAHKGGPAATVVCQIGERLDVPVRLHHDEIVYSGAFYGADGRGAPFFDGVSVEALVEVIATLPDGVTELGCHPSFPFDDSVSVYARQRPVELRSLCDPAVRAALVARNATLVPTSRYTFRSTRQ